MKRNWNSLVIGERLKILPPMPEWPVRDKTDAGKGRSHQSVQRAPGGSRNRYLHGVCAYAHPTTQQRPSQQRVIQYPGGDVRGMFKATGSAELHAGAKLTNRQPKRGRAPLQSSRQQGQTRRRSPPAGPTREDTLYDSPSRRLTAGKMNLWREKPGWQLPLGVGVAGTGQALGFWDAGGVPCLNPEASSTGMCAV